MAAPQSYTEDTLAAFMVAALGDVSGVLGWTVLSDVQEAVNSALLLYGVYDIAAATDITRLRALSRVTAWRAAVASLSVRFDFSNPEGSYKRSQMLAGARAALGDAESEAGPYLGGGYGAQVTELDRTDDPYSAGLAHEWATA